MFDGSKIILDGTFNTRDMGGLITESGRRVRKGLIYRSDALNNLSIKDIEFFEKIGLKTIVDFRGKDEIEAAPNKIIANTVTVHLPPQANIANLASGNIVNDQEKIDTLLKEASTREGVDNLESRLDEMEDEMIRLASNENSIRQYSKFLKLLKNKDNYPLLHHCKGGKDRTGFASIVLYLVLGVSEDEILKEYMLTKEFMLERNKKRMSEYMKYTDNKVVLQYLNGLMQTKEKYALAALKAIGDKDTFIKEKMKLDDTEIEEIRSILLE